MVGGAGVGGAFGVSRRQCAGRLRAVARIPRSAWVSSRGIEQVRLRSDTAGYQHDLLEYCDSGEDPRFGRIEFGVGCPVSKEFKRAVSEVCEDDWHCMYAEKDRETIVTRRQWAEVCFVPNELARSKTGRHYRYLATREAIEDQQCLPGTQDEKQYPFQTITTNGRKYKVFGIVTNRDVNGNDLINWLHERCGESEEVHRAMKDDFAGESCPVVDLVRTRPGGGSCFWRSILMR